MATYPLTWLADVLRTAGCRVIEEDGWKTRGRDGSFAPKAIMLHHDASPKGETSNGVDVIINGHGDLPGPLSQLWLDYDGRWHVVAAGRANHGGTGGPWGVVSLDDANADAIGIETDHTTDEKWTDSQLSQGIKGVAALCRRLGITTEAQIGSAVLAHKEYAPDRKVDPDPLDMDRARANLFDYMNDGGLFAMSTVDVFSNPGTQKFKGNGTFKTVTIDQDGAYSLLTGPKEGYVVSAGLTIEPSGEDDSIAAGDIVQIRLQSVIDYEGDKPTVIDTPYPVVEVPITAGASFGNVTWANKIAGDAGDGRRRLRLFILAPQGKTLKVTHVSARALY